jgi:hypothetical protein
LWSRSEQKKAEIRIEKSVKYITYGRGWLGYRLRAGQHIGLAGNNTNEGAKMINNSKKAKTTDQIRELTMKELDEVSGGLQSEDRLGNTQIQTLMSNYNEPPTVKR